MDCKQYHELISLYVDGELGILDEEKLHKHIALCDKCNIYMKNMLYLKSNIKESYSLNTCNVDFSKAIMHKIKAKKGNSKVIPLFKERVSKVSLVKKSISLVLLLLVFILFSFFINNQFNNKNNIENLVIQHLDNSFLQEFPDVENVNLLQ
jgi:predicted anti-sigma-YlaC factor YlaD